MDWQVSYECPELTWNDDYMIEHFSFLYYIVKRRSDNKRVGVATTLDKAKIVAEKNNELQKSRKKED